MRARSRSVLVVAPGAVGPSATGPARRAAQLAEALSGECAVTLAAPGGAALTDGGRCAGVDVPSGDVRRLAGLAASHEVVVVQAIVSPRPFLTLVRHARRLVVDAIAPLAFEAAHAPRQTTRQRAAVARLRVRQLVDALRAADLVLCTNERQRDLFSGAATAATGDVPDRDRIVVVPHGLDDDPPRSTGRPLRDAGRIGPDERLVVWGGGMWGWLDPLTPIRAVERLRVRRPEVRLAFVGTGRDCGPGAGAGDEAVAYTRDRGLEGDAVIFVHGWLERGRYLDHLLEADAGVSAHPNTLEARYGTRTRIVDYLWAGLPVACTRGDAMAEFVEDRGLGMTAAPGDVDGLAAAMEQAVSRGRGSWDRGALEPLLWRNAVRPLLDYCRDPDALPRRRRAYRPRHAAGLYVAMLEALYREAGPAGLAGAASRRLRRRY